MKIQLTVFDVAGYLAHFRKYFSTASSLTYSFPPRTTIAGMIAGILGYERDSYYELFSSEKCRIALKLMEPVRRITHTVNYLMTDKPLTIKKLRGIGPSAQVHMEVLISGDHSLSELRYRIFFNHDDSSVQEAVARRIAEEKFYYPPSLGAANFITDVTYIDTVYGEVFKPEGEIDVCTVIPTSIIKSLNPLEGTKIYLEELVPADFTSNRLLSRKETYIYEGSGRRIRVCIEGEAFICSLSGEKIIGVFM